MQQEIDALVADRRLAMADKGARIALDLDANAGVALPRLDDVAGLTAKSALEFSTSDQIEALLSLDAVSDLSVEGGKLNRLLEVDWMSAEERAVLRTGMLFLRRGRFVEAREWWLLHSPKDARTPFALVLQLLCAMTWRLRGDEQRAIALLNDLRPRIAQLRGNARP